MENIILTDEDLQVIETLATFSGKCNECHKQLIMDTQPRRIYPLVESINSDDMTLYYKQITVNVCNACGIRWYRRNQKHKQQHMLFYT